MIESPKSAEIVRECRGLVLDYKQNWKLVARAFRRFFNAGEVPADDKKFNWENPVVCTHKEDGSLILLYHHNDSWKVNTRFSFAEQTVNGSIYTWTDLVKMAWNYNKASLSEDVTYVLELCTPFNKVVRAYSKPKVYMLSAFNTEHNWEFSYETVQAFARSLGLDSPNTIVARDLFDIQGYIARVAENDPTFEGIVVRDVFNNRLKVKSSLYLHLHRLNNNGNVASVKNLLPLILAGETDEVLTYFPEMKDSIDQITTRVDAVKREIDSVWFAWGPEKSPKKFALAIQKDTKYTAPLFSARKLGGHPFDYLTNEYLLKHVFE